MRMKNCFYVRIHEEGPKTKFEVLEPNIKKGFQVPYVEQEEQSKEEKKERRKDMKRSSENQRMVFKTPVVRTVLCVRIL